MTENGAIPVTVVSGYLGAGKTTLINHVLSNPGERRVAVIVNDMGEINVDAELIARENDDEGIVDLSNGCICCRLQGDLLAEAARLAESRAFDYLMVESSGISEPIPVAQVFTEGTDESDVDPTTLFRLDTMVTVLDTYGFWKEFDAGERLPEGAQPDADRPLSEVLVEGIEFCDVLLLNKSDMVPEDVLEEIEAVVETLQPRANRLRTSYCEVDPDVVLDTDRFDFERAKRSQGWKRHLRGDADGHDHEGRSAAETHGVSSFVFRSDRPFHPERLADWLEDWDGAIVRAKGVCYVADREEVIGVSQAGPSVRAGPIGEWRPDDDRRTQLVFIGREMDEERIREELEACVIEGDEAAATDAMADPFPL
ncbi:GTP-binding protein [Haloterrigena salinisoli]|uniref:CobW family GTP-binding protein n=1 Tax=Haloterrigena salinisoli TaxID=3132747 RepID=UPI0030D3BE47